MNYKKTHVRKDQSHTDHWLKAAKNSGIEVNKHNVDDLRNCLRFHEHRYYVLNDPLISDYEYDQLFKLLQHYEEAHPKEITPDSPTQRVGPGLVKDFPKVEHLVPMLSLDNSYNAEDLIDWDRKVRELGSEENIEYCIEPKFDGASISLVYEDDLLTAGLPGATGLPATISASISGGSSQFPSPRHSAIMEFSRLKCGVKC